MPNSGEEKYYMPLLPVLLQIEVSTLEPPLGLVVSISEQRPRLVVGLLKIALPGRCGIRSTTMTESAPSTISVEIDALPQCEVFDARKDHKATVFFLHVRIPYSI